VAIKKKIATEDIKERKKTVRLELCLPSMSSQTIKQSHPDPPSSAPPRLLLINQLWLKIINQIANQTPDFKIWVRQIIGHCGEMSSFKFSL